MEFYGEDGVTTGASGDLRSATAMAEQMVCDYGMDGSLMVVGEGKRELPWVTESVKRILNEQYGRACTLIREGRARLETLANALIDKNSLDGEALKNILEGENG